MVVVKKAAKDVAKKEGMRFPDKAVDALEDKVIEMIKKACERAKANKRKTIIEADF